MLVRSHTDCTGHRYILLTFCSVPVQFIIVLADFTVAVLGGTLTRMLMLLLLLALF